MSTETKIAQHAAAKQQINDIFKQTNNTMPNKDPKLEIPFPPVDDEYCESVVCPTPNGGDYSTAYFYDKEGRPCHREDAAYVNIVEFKKGGVRVWETYGEIAED